MLELQINNFKKITLDHNLTFLNMNKIKIIYCDKFNNTIFYHDEDLYELNKSIEYNNNMNLMIKINIDDKHFFI